MERFQHSGSAPGANTNNTTLFDSTAVFGLGQMGARGYRSFALTIKNSHSGSVVASMRDSSGTWQAFRTESVVASDAGASNSIVIEVGHCAELKVEWTNGGSAQTTWFAAMVLTTLDRDEFQLDDDEDVGGDFSVGGDVAIAGALEVDGAATLSGAVAVGDDLSVDGDIAVTGTVDSRDIAADGTLLDATSRGYRGVRAVTAQTDTTVLADAGKLITCANATSTAVTIPPNASVAYAAGERIDVTALSGAGAVTLVAGGGVTLTPATGKTLVLAAAGIARVTKLATNTWVATGDLVSA